METGTRKHEARRNLRQERTAAKSWYIADNVDTFFSLENETDKTNEAAFSRLLYISSNQDVLTSFQETVESPASKKWLQALRDEINSLYKMGGWNLVTLPKGSKVVRISWIFDIERDGAEEDCRYEARLLAKGYGQIQGKHFYEVYAPVSKNATVRLMFAISVMYNQKWSYTNVRSAFVNAPLQAKFYVQQHNVFVNMKKKKHVYQLKEALYEFRQASQEWNLHLHQFLSDFRLRHALQE